MEHLTEAGKIPEGIRVTDFPKYLRPALLSELGKDVKFKTWDRIGGYFDQITNTIFYPKGDKETLIHELMHLIEHSPAIGGLSKSLIKAGYYKKGEIGKMLQWYLTSEDGFALGNTEPKAWLIINTFLKKYNSAEVLRKNPQELKGLRELIGLGVSKVELKPLNSDSNPRNKLKDIFPAGRAWRAESSLWIRGKTAQDIVDFEADELGNEDIREQAESLGLDLKAIHEREVVWVTATKKEAETYSLEGEVPIVEVEIPSNSVILATDYEGGYLVWLRNATEHLT